MTNILDNDLSAFLIAQKAFLEDKGEGELVVECDQPLRKLIDPKRLQSRLDRINEFKLEPVHRQYLELSELFSGEFLDFLAGPYPETKVLSRGDDIRVIVKGTHANLALWVHAIESQIHSLNYSGAVEEYGLDWEALRIEAIRRFQVKMDLLRNSGTRFVEGGSRYRPDWTWYSLLLPTIMGDVPDLLLGTTNVNMALTHGIPPLSLEPGLGGGLTDIVKFDRIAGATVDAIGALDGVVVVVDPNAFQMAHLHSHFGRRIIFEWGADLTADIGPVGGRLPLSFTTK